MPPEQPNRPPKSTRKEAATPNQRYLAGHYPFRSHFLSLHGLRYHYLDEGSGPPVLMLHGNPTWSFYFRHLICGLRDFCRVIVPDHMGCGLSAKPRLGGYDFRLQSRVDDLEALIDALGIRRGVTLVMHDWGGMIGMAWAVRHPRRVARLVILNTAAFLPPGGKKLPLRLQLVRRGGPLAAGAVLGLNLFARAAVYMAPARPLRPEIRQALLAPYATPASRLATLWFVRDIPLSRCDPSYELVRRVDGGLQRFKDRPALICWGAKDFVFDTDYLAAWRRRLPQAEVHVFKNAGHYLLEDAPQAVSARVRHFLQKNAGAVYRS